MGKHAMPSSSRGGASSRAAGSCAFFTVAPLHHRRLSPLLPRAPSPPPASPADLQVTNRVHGKLYSLEGTSKKGHLIPGRILSIIFQSFMKRKAQFCGLKLGVCGQMGVAVCGFMLVWWGSALGEEFTYPYGIRTTRGVVIGSIVTHTYNSLQWKAPTIETLAMDYHRGVGVEKKRDFSGSPESTLSWTVSEPSQVRSSPTTPFVQAEEDNVNNSTFANKGLGSSSNQLTLYI